MLDIRLENIKDQGTRDVIDNIQSAIRSQSILNFFWGFFSLTFTIGGSYTYPHGLGFRPKDFLITGILDSSGAAAYIDLDSCTSTDYVIVVSGACTVRFLLGNLDTTSQF